MNFGILENEGTDFDTGLPTLPENMIWKVEDFPDHGFDYEISVVYVTKGWFGRTRYIKSDYYWELFNYGDSLFLAAGRALERGREEAARETIPGFYPPNRVIDFLERT